METLTKVHVGVDVSKATLDVCVHLMGDEFRVANTKKGIKILQKHLAKYTVVGIVCESTGGYETLMLDMLDNAGYATLQVDPRRIKGWSVAQGNKVKTDQRDAAIIAAFSAQMYPTSVPKKVKKNMNLTLLHNRQKALTKHIAMEKNRLKHPQCNKEIKDSIERALKFLNKELNLIIKKITAIAHNDVYMLQSIQILTSVPGVGEKTAIALITTLPELGQINDKEIAALVGVAPYTRQSGTYTGKSFVRDGREHARSALFMAAFVAIQCNVKLKEFYNRLREAGKSHMVALIASMRKLIVILNAMVRGGTMWNLA